MLLNLAFFCEFLKVPKKRAGRYTNFWNTLTDLKKPTHEALKNEKFSFKKILKSAKKVEIFFKADATIIFCMF